MAWRTRETVLESVTVGQVVAPAAPDRIALYIINMGTVNVHITTRAPPYASNAGLTVKADDFENLYWARDGDLAREEWRIVDPQLAQEMVVIEEVYEPDGS